ncbi:MAG: hypothetical protein AAF517_04160 [Planctomycetota bacterium]
MTSSEEEPFRANPHVAAGLVAGAVSVLACVMFNEPELSLLVGLPFVAGGFAGQTMHRESSSGWAILGGLGVISVALVALDVGFGFQGWLGLTSVPSAIVGAAIGYLVASVVSASPPRTRDGGGES